MRPSKPTQQASAATAVVTALIAAATLAGCVAGSTPSGSAAQSPSVVTGATTAPSGTATTSPQRGLGVDRATFRAAIDAAIAPDTIEWQEQGLTDGTPTLEGYSYRTALTVVLAGPPEDVAAVQVSGFAPASPDDAPVALAAVRTAAPTLEGWWRSTFEGPGDAHRHDEAGLTVFWRRDMPWADGARVSMLLIAPTALAPKPTPVPTPRVTPAPTPLPELESYLPTSIDGRPVTASSWTGATMPDVPDCLPICRWQVAAYADVLGIRPEAVEVGLATGEPTAPIQVAVVRVPHPDMPFVFAYWEQALEREWPEVHRDTVDVVPGQAFFAFRQRLTGPQEIAPAWYVRWLGDVLVIVSDEVAQSVGSQPRTRVSALLEALPTPR